MNQWLHCRACHQSGRHALDGVLLCTQHLIVALDFLGWTGHLEDPPTFPPNVLVGPSGPARITDRDKERM
jgi:hypothetical protein